MMLTLMDLVQYISRISQYIIGILHSVSSPFLLEDNFHSIIVKERGSEKKINALGDLKSSCHTSLALSLVKKDFVKQIVVLKAQFQMLVLVCFSQATN